MLKMNHFRISLPFVSSKQAPKTKILVFLGLLFLIVGLLGAIWDQEQIKLVFLVAGALAIWVAGLFKSYHVIGKIEITPNSIITEDEGGQAIYDLHAVEDLQLFLEDIKGEVKFSFNTFSLKQGENNRIQFTYHGEKKKLFFLLEESMTFSIRLLIDHWLSSQVKFKLHDRTNLT